MITEDKKLTVLASISELIEFMDGAAARYWGEHYEFLAPPTHDYEAGRRYIRIVQEQGSGGRHVHCFVDAQTGGVYKAAGWKAPALNGERFNLLDPESVQLLKDTWDPHGGYLYKR